MNNIFDSIKKRFKNLFGSSIDDQTIAENFFRTQRDNFNVEIFQKSEDVNVLHENYAQSINEFDDQLIKAESDTELTASIQRRKERYERKHLADVLEVKTAIKDLLKKSQSCEEGINLLKGEVIEDGIEFGQFAVASTILVKGHELGYISDDMFEKAKQHVNQLVKKDVQVTRKGKTFTEQRMVNPNQKQSQPKTKKQDESGESEKVPSLEKHARSTSTEQLTAVAATAHNEDIRVAAKKELQRREVEEDGGSEEEKKTAAKSSTPKETKAKKEKQEQFWDKYKFPALNGYPLNVPEDQVKVNTTGDINSHAVMSWKDSKTGKMCYSYTREFMERNAQNKWKRIANINQGRVDKIKNSALALLDSEDETEQEAGAIISIMVQSGLRPGDKEQFKNTGNRGISTLAAENIKVKGDTINLSFKGKSYVDNVSEFKDPKLAKYLSEKMKDGKDKQFLFDIDKNSLTTMFKDQMGGKGMKLKDMRTYVATALAGKILFEDNQEPPPLPKGASKTELKTLVQSKLKHVFETVSTKLNNTPAMAKSSYVHPNVIHEWLNKLGPEAHQFYKSDEDEFDDQEDQQDEDFSLDELLQKDKPQRGKMADLNEEDEDNCDQYPLPSWWDEDLDDQEDSDQEIEKAIEDELEKGGKPAILGEKRMFGGREYIKTSEGWKFHGKGTGTKAQEHAAKHEEKDAKEEEFKWNKKMRPSEEEWNKAKSLGKGAEGDVKDFKTFAVKRLFNHDQDTIDIISNLQKQPNPLYIDFYDHWIDNGKTYISMQKLNSKELADAKIGEEELEESGCSMVDIYLSLLEKRYGEDWSKDNVVKTLPKEYLKIKDNKLAQFLLNVVNIKDAPQDIDISNIALVNGHYKLFDCW